MNRLTKIATAAALAAIALGPVVAVAAPESAEPVAKVQTSVASDQGQNKQLGTRLRIKNETSNSFWLCDASRRQVKEVKPGQEVVYQGSAPLEKDIQTFLSKTQDLSDLWALSADNPFGFSPYIQFGAATSSNQHGFSHQNEGYKFETTWYKTLAGDFWAWRGEDSADYKEFWLTCERMY